jgi:hypothetical protein
MIRMLIAHSVNGYKVFKDFRPVGYITAIEDKYEVYRYLEDGSVSPHGIMTFQEARNLFEALYN